MKINIAKIRTNSHELNTKNEYWSIPKTSWNERFCHLCDTKRVENEKHSLRVFLNHNFKYVLHNILPNLLTHQKCR